MITDVNANLIQACCEFDYKGYEVSCSTIFNAHFMEIAVFKNNRFQEDFHTVQDAIKWCDDAALHVSNPPEGKV